MLKLIGFIVLWIVGVVNVTIFVNAVRARRGSDLNDWTTHFCEGFAFGPIGIVSAFGPRERSTGRTVPRLVGGIAGCIVAYNLWEML